MPPPERPPPDDPDERDELDQLPLDRFEPLEPPDPHPPPSSSPRDVAHESNALPISPPAREAQPSPQAGRESQKLRYGDTCRYRAGEVRAAATLNVSAGTSICGRTAGGAVRYNSPSA